MNEPSFAPGVVGTKLVWRGPVWMNTNWYISRGLRRHGQADLARHIEDRSAALVERSGFREYYNPLTGEGHGAVDFSWTALVVDMLARPGGGRRRRADVTRSALHRLGRLARSVAAAAELCARAAPPEARARPRVHQGPLHARRTRRRPLPVRALRRARGHDAPRRSRTATTRPAARTSSTSACSSPAPLELGSPALSRLERRQPVEAWPPSARPRPRRDTGPGRSPPGRWHVAARPVQGRGRRASTSRSRSRPSAARGHRGAAVALAPRPPEPLRRGARWYSGGLHMPHRAQRRHADRAPRSRACAREAGLDFIAITDHNNTTHQLERVARGRPAADRGRGGDDARRPRQRLGPGRLARLRSISASCPGTRASPTSCARPAPAARCSPSTIRARPARAAAGSTPSPKASTGIEIANGNHGEMAQRRSPCGTTS